MSIHRYVLNVSHLWYHHLFLPTHMKENNNANPSIRLQSSNSYKTIFLILNYNLHVLACINTSLLSPLFNLSDLSMAGCSRYDCSSIITAEVIMHTSSYTF